MRELSDLGIGVEGGGLPKGASGRRLLALAKSSGCCSAYPGVLVPLKGLGEKRHRKRRVGVSQSTKGCRLDGRVSASEPGAQVHQGQVVDVGGEQARRLTRAARERSKHWGGSAPGAGGEPLQGARGKTLGGSGIEASVEQRELPGGRLFAAWPLPWSQQEGAGGGGQGAAKGLSSNGAGDDLVFAGEELRGSVRQGNRKSPSGGSPVRREVVVAGFRRTGAEQAAHRPIEGAALRFGTTTSQTHTENAQSPGSAPGIAEPAGEPFRRAGPIGARQRFRCCQRQGAVQGLHQSVRRGRRVEPGQGEQERRLSLRRRAVLLRCAEASPSQTEQGSFEIRMGLFGEQLEHLRRDGEIVCCRLQQRAHRPSGEGVARRPEHAQSDDSVRLLPAVLQPMTSELPSLGKPQAKERPRSQGGARRGVLEHDRSQEIESFGVGELSQKLDRGPGGGKPEQRLEARRRIGEQGLAGGTGQRRAAGQELPESPDRLGVPTARQGEGSGVQSPGVVGRHVFGSDAHQAEQGSAGVRMVCVPGERAGESQAKAPLHFGRSFGGPRRSLGRADTPPGRRGRAAAPGRGDFTQGADDVDEGLAAARMTGAPEAFEGAELFVPVGAFQILSKASPLPDPATLGVSFGSRLGRCARAGDGKGCRQRAGEQKGHPAPSGGTPLPERLALAELRRSGHRGGE